MLPSHPPDERSQPVVATASEATKAFEPSWDRASARKPPSRPVWGPARQSTRLLLRFFFARWHRYFPPNAPTARNHLRRHRHEATQAGAPMRHPSLTAHRPLCVVCTALAAAVWLPAVHAQSATTAAADGPTLGEVTVSTPRGAAPPFEVPASVDRVDGEQLRDGKLQVNLSESLLAVPGLQVQNRQNYAQDLQLSIRGFGARSTFGCAACGCMSTASRPRCRTARARRRTSTSARPTASRCCAGRSRRCTATHPAAWCRCSPRTVKGRRRLAIRLPVAATARCATSPRLAGSSGAVDYLLAWQPFPHRRLSRPQRGQRDIVNGKLGIELDDGSQLTLVAQQRDARRAGPAGPDRRASRRRRRAAPPWPTQYDTRKTVDQTQLGALYEKRIDATNDLRLMALRRSSARPRSSSRSRRGAAAR